MLCVSGIDELPIDENTMNQIYLSYELWLIWQYNLTCFDKAVLEYIILNDNSVIKNTYMHASSFRVLAGN